METLTRSIASFSARHANTAFFLAINAGRADDILSGGELTADHLEGPVHLTASLEHAQNYLPHHPVVEFIMKPTAKVLDMRFHPKSEAGKWDATLPEEEDKKIPLGRAGLVEEGLVDAFFHELEDVLEVHNPEVLTPVRIHPPILSGTREA